MSHSQPRPFHMLGGGGHNAGGQLMHNVSIIDTTYTKLFVGGLAWETQRDTMRHYFEQFGEIQEAVVITDKNTGRSKGYGFVTFKDPDAAMRACQNPSPVIDGRRANCNLASLGAQKPHPPVPHHEITNIGGAGRFRPGSALVGPSAYHGSSSSTYFHQPTGQYTLPYSAYGYSGYSQDTMYPMQNYYSMYGGQQYSPYYNTGASGATGIYANYYPYYPQYSQNSQGQGLGVQYPQVLHYPYLPQRYAASGILSLPPSVLATTASDATLVAGRTQNAGSVTVMGGVVGTVAAAASQATRTPEPSSSN